jgi:hypothetical protein
MNSKLTKSNRQLESLGSVDGALHQFGIHLNSFEAKQVVSHGRPDLIIHQTVLLLINCLFPPSESWNCILLHHNVVPSYFKIPNPKRNCKAGDRHKIAVAGLTMAFQDDALPLVCLARHPYLQSLVGPFRPCVEWPGRSF